MIFVISFPILIDRQLTKQGEKDKINIEIVRFVPRHSGIASNQFSLRFYSSHACAY